MSKENNNVISLEEHFGGSAPDSTNKSHSGHLPTCPDYLSDKAKAHWPELVKDLGNHGIINELDKDMLGIYCNMFARFIELDEKLNDPEGPGMTQLTKNKYEVETATFTAWKSMLKPIMSYAKQLGLTPPARIAMKVTDAKQEEMTF